MIAGSFGRSKRRQAWCNEKVTEEEIMPTMGDGAAFAHAILPDKLKQWSYKPTEEEAAQAKALINSLMQDRFFLALYRSNDPKVRAAAMDRLNNAHCQAYGDAPTKDDDAGQGK
jgi:hypothetical protein